MSTDDIDSHVLLSVVEHVFLPPKLAPRLPQFQHATESAQRETNVTLCHILIQAARDFSQGLSSLQQSLWARIIKMMESIYSTAKSPQVEAELTNTLSNLTIGGGLDSPPVCCIVVHLRFQMSS